MLAFHNAVARYSAIAADRAGNLAVHLARAATRGRHGPGTRSPLRRAAPWSRRFGVPPALGVAGAFAELAAVWRGRRPGRRRPRASGEATTLVLEVFRRYPAVEREPQPI